MLHFFTADVVYVSHARNAIYRNRKVIAFCIYVCCRERARERERKDNRMRLSFGVKNEKKNWKIIFVFKLLCAENEYCIRQAKTSFVLISHKRNGPLRILAENWKFKNKSIFHCTVKNRRLERNWRKCNWQMFCVRLCVWQWMNGHLNVYVPRTSDTLGWTGSVCVCARLINLLYIWTVLFPAQKRFESNTSPRMQFIYLFILVAVVVYLWAFA